MTTLSHWQYAALIELQRGNAAGLRAHRIKPGSGCEELERSGYVGFSTEACRCCGKRYYELTPVGRAAMRCYEAAQKNVHIGGLS